MTWDSLVVALVLCHLIGDFLLQTDWQARHKAGGLGGGIHARALGAHVGGYVIGMLPAAVWIAQEHGIASGVLALIAIAVPHGIQDDRRLLAAYARRVKGADPEQEPLVMFWLDQAGHVLALGALALAVTA